MNYKETLPENCPPLAAEEITSPLELYRLVQSNPPNENDFRSQRTENPNSNFKVDECIARGISVYANRSCCDKTLKLPKFRKHLVCKVFLDQGAGKIQQTFQPSHHTWWPLADFDILNRCSLEKS